MIVVLLTKLKQHRLLYGEGSSTTVVFMHVYAVLDSMKKKKDFFPLFYENSLCMKTKMDLCTDIRYLNE